MGSRSGRQRVGWWRVLPAAVLVAAAGCRGAGADGDAPADTPVRVAHIEILGPG